MVKYTERAAGVYRATFTKLDTAFTMTDKDSGEEITRWRWVFQDVSDSTTMGELDTLTSPGFKPRSNGLKFLSGMLGRLPTNEDDTDSVMGQTFDVTYGPNQAGRLTVIAVTRPTPAPQTGQDAATFAAENKGDLPF